MRDVITRPDRDVERLDSCVKRLKRQFRWAGCGVRQPRQDVDVVACGENDGTKAMSGIDRGRRGFPNALVNEQCRLVARISAHLSRSIATCVRFETSEGCGYEPSMRWIFVLF